MAESSQPKNLGSFLAQFKKKPAVAPEVAPSSSSVPPPSSVPPSSSDPPVAAAAAPTVSVLVTPNPEDKQLLASAFRERMTLGKKRPRETTSSDDDLLAKKEFQDERSAKQEDAEESIRAIEEELMDEIPPEEDVHPAAFGVGRVQQLVFDADQLRFGNEVMAPVNMYVQVPLSAQRYSPQEQVSDLLDELLSHVPKYRRTQSAMNQIHCMVQRFSQLRQEYSQFDDNQNVKGFAYPATGEKESPKPLSLFLQHFDRKLSWIVPTVLCERKLQSFSKGKRRGHLEDEEHEEDQGDPTEQEDQDYWLISSDEAARDLLRGLASIGLSVNQQQTIGGDINKYKEYCEQLQTRMMPFLPAPIQSHQYLHLLPLKLDQDALSNNFDVGLSTACAEGHLSSTPYVDMRHTTALSMLSGICSNERQRVTSNESLPLKSVLMLPSPMVRYSKVCLPGTHILERSKLNALGGFFLTSWLRNGKTRVTEVQIEDVHIDIDFGDSSQFLQGVKNFGVVPCRALSEDDYQQFCAAIVPETSALIDLYQHELRHSFSLLSGIHCLEPFWIYGKNISLVARDKLVKLVDGNLRELRKSVEKLRKRFHLLRQLQSAPLMVANTYTVLNNLITPAEFDKVVCEKYDLRSCRDVDAIRQYSNLEYLVRILRRDDMRLYADAVGLINFHLTYAKEFETLLAEETSSTERSKQEAAASSDCGPVIVAKYYKNEAELKGDNGKVIFFDKKYDRTDYSQLDMYEDAIAAYDSDELLAYLIEDLQRQHVGMTEDDATYLANTLLDGHKEVRDGHYAILHKGYQKLAKDETELYRRDRGQWVVATDLDESTMTAAAIADDSDILCYLREKCMALQQEVGDDRCESSKEETLGLRAALLREIINEFDQKFNLSSEQSEALAKQHFVYDAENADRLSQIQAHKQLKYNQIQYLLGFQLQQQQQQLSAASDDIREISPYQDLLNNILAQEDVEMRMRNLLKFVERFCLESADGIWFICRKTRCPLVPVFRITLASCFIKHSPSLFQQQLQAIKKDFGATTDGFWVDKRTGWRICEVDPAPWEEIDEDGQKIPMGSVLYGAAASGVSEGGEALDQVRSYTVHADTVQIQVIHSVVQRISAALTVSLSRQLEFIVGVVAQFISEELKSEEDYRSLVATISSKSSEKDKKKQPIPYDQYVHMTYMYAILAAMIYAIQTSNPSVRPRRRFEGCPQLCSFAGYPMGREDDSSCIQYVVCVTQAIAGKQPPMNALPSAKKFQQVVDQVRHTLSKMSTYDSVRHKKEMKIMQMVDSGAADELPLDQTIYQFVHFLPPLVPFQVSPSLSQRPGDAFFDSLNSQLRTGNPAQQTSILVLRSKILAASLALVQQVDSIVKEEHLLLESSDQYRPLLENACCQTDAQSRSNALSYFEKKNREVSVHNLAIRSMTKKLWDAYDWYQGDVLRCAQNSKLVYPSLPAGFTEHTIFLVFIHYCKFLSSMPIPLHLQAFCPRKPEEKEKEEWRKHETRESLIRKMRDENRGKDFTVQTMDILLQQVSKKNVVPVARKELSLLMSPLDRFRHFLENSSLHFDARFRELLLRSLADSSSSSTQPLKDLMDHVTQRSGDILRKMKRALEHCEKKQSRTLSELNRWEDWQHLDVSVPSSLQTVIQFWKTTLHNVCSVFPSTLLHGSVKQFQDQQRRQFPYEHVQKLNHALAHDQNPLQPFFQNPVLLKLLNRIQQVSKELLLLTDITPCLRAQSSAANLLPPSRTKMLLEFYALSALDQYFQLAEDKKMLVSSENQRGKQFCLRATEVEEEDEEGDDVQWMVEEAEREQTSILAVQQQELKQTVCKLVSAFMQVIFRTKATLDQNYQTIQDINFKLRQKETDRFVETVKRMNEEERKTYRQLKTLGLTSIGFSAKETNRYNTKRYLEEQDLRMRQEEAEESLLEQLRFGNVEEEESQRFGNEISPEAEDNDVLLPEEEEVADPEWNLPFDADNDD